jgi:TRAP-type C4-dicarboxylate transport system substrate-binding protein
MSPSRIALLVLAWLFLIPAHAVQAAQVIKIATLSPDGTSWMRAMRAAGDEITKRSQGRVELRFYPGGVMGNDQSVMRKIRAGQLQGGAVTVGALTGVDKDIEVYGIPFLFRDLQEVDQVRKRMDDTLLGNLESKGFVGFGFAEGGFAYLMSNRPLKTVADLKAGKVWAPEGDTISLTAFESVGVSPITLPLMDVLTALQTGLLDTVASPPAGAIALQWHTRVKYLTEVPLLYTYGVLVITDKAFKKLSVQDQALLREVLGRSFREIDAQSRRDNEGALKALRGQGIQFLQPPPRDMEGWRRTVDTAQQRLVAQGYFSRQVVDKVRKILADHRAGR